MRFLMAQRGSVFSTQDRAVRLLAELEEEEARRNAGDNELILDFSDVEHIGPSFATAFVARIFIERREADLPRPRIEDAIDVVQAKIDAALAGTEASPQSLAA